MSSWPWMRRHSVEKLEMQASPWLGHVGGVSARRCYPLSAVLATSLTAPRTVLIGEAAHALSPIGAQGLNLSLQDVSHLGDLISEAIRTMADPGAAALLQTYSKKTDARHSRAVPCRRRAQSHGGERLAHDRLCCARSVCRTTRQASFPAPWPDAGDDAPRSRYQMLSCAWQPNSSQRPSKTLNEN